MKLGIIGAMSVEVALLKSYMTDSTVSVYAGMEFCQGNIDGVSCVVVQCGVGKVNAALCVQILCDCFQVTNIVNTGVAGSLCAELDIGDLVISEDAVYHDFDCTPLGYAIGQVPGLDTLAFPADEAMISKAKAAAHQVQPGHFFLGRVASGDQFVSDKEVKDKIISTTNAICTEMEGAAIAHAAWRNGVPFVVLRAISDKADNSAQMDYPVFEEMAAKRCSDVIRAFVNQMK